MLVRWSLVLALLAEAVAARQAWAVDPAVTQAVTWLESHANPSGSWGAAQQPGGPYTTEFRDTAIATDFLHRAGGNAGVIAAGLAFLATGPSLESEAGGAVAAPLNTDEVARRAWATLRAGQPATGDLTALLATQRPQISDATWRDYPGGGWGILDGYSSDSLDTALALQAFAAAGAGATLLQQDISLPPGGYTYLSLSVPAAATALRVRIYDVTGGGYLDVGLRLKSGAQPSASDPMIIVYPGYISTAPGTLGVLTPGVNWIRFDSNLFQPRMFSVQVSLSLPFGDTAHLADALQFLRACQNADGGFGLRPGEPSQVLATLEVTAALAAFYRLPVQDALDSAYSYIATQQQGDGGFGSNGTSSILESGMALSLLKRKAPQSPAAADALSFLRSRQASGAWDANAVTTALAGASILGPDSLDDDGDPVLPFYDNCPLRANAGQTDVDNDGVGDVCDNLCVGTPTTITNAPSSTPTGSVLTLSGTGFGANRQVWIGGVQAAVIAATGSVVSVNVPASLAAGLTYQVVVINPEGCQSQDDIRLAVTAPSGCGLLGIEPMAVLAMAGGFSRVRKVRCRCRFELSPGNRDRSRSA